MGKNNYKKKARRNARKARQTRRATPKTDASKARRTPCTGACADTCQAEYEGMLKLMGEIEANDGNVSFANSQTGESRGDDTDKTDIALAHLDVAVLVDNRPVASVFATGNGADVRFDGNAILKMTKQGQPGETRLGIAAAPRMGEIPFHFALKSTHPESRGSTVLEIVRTGKTSWFDWSPERLEAIRKRFSGGDYSDGHGQLVLTFGDIADAITASDIPCIDEPVAC